MFTGAYAALVAPLRDGEVLESGLRDPVCPSFVCHQSAVPLIKLDSCFLAALSFLFRAHR